MSDDWTTCVLFSLCLKLWNVYRLRTCFGGYYICMVQLMHIMPWRLSSVSLCGKFRRSHCCNRLDSRCNLLLNVFMMCFSLPCSSRLTLSVRSVRKAKSNSHWLSSSCAYSAWFERFRNSLISDNNSENCSRNVPLLSHLTSVCSSRSVERFTLFAQSNEPSRASKHCWSRGLGLSPTKIFFGRPRLD